MWLKKKSLKSTVISFLYLFGSSSAQAHVSEQGIVLLLPTDIYILSGCLAVIVSMLLVALLPHKGVFAICKPVEFSHPRLQSHLRFERLKDLTSLMSLCLVLFLIVVGAIGIRDPLANLLPLTIWTFFWIAIFIAHGLFGNLWIWINPWTGFYNLFFAEGATYVSLPKKLGHMPAIILYVAFYLFRPHPFRRASCNDLRGAHQ